MHHLKPNKTCNLSKGDTMNIADQDIIAVDKARVRPDGRMPLTEHDKIEDERAKHAANRNNN